MTEFSWIYRQNHISSKLILTYILFGCSAVPFYHSITPIIFSMGITEENGKVDQ